MKILKTLFFLFLTMPSLYAQHVSKLAETIEHLNETRAYNVAADIDFRRTERHGFTDNGSLVAIIDSALVCYGTDGQIEWQRAVPAQAIHISPDGQHVLISYSVSSDSGVTEVLTSSGKVLWTQPFMGWVLWSPQSEYLYPHADQDSPLFLRTYDAQTGRLLWQDDKRPMAMIEAIHALGEGTLLIVDVEARLLALEMRTGHILQEFDIGASFKERLSYVDWNISTSEDANYFTVLGRCSSPESGAIYSFDKDYNLLWSKKVSSKTWPRGLTEDGSKLVVREGNKTKLYKNLTGDFIWQDTGAGFRQDVVVTNAIIAIPQLHGTYVFDLAADGSLENRWITSSIIRKIGRKIFEVTQQNSQNVILVLEEKSNENKK